MIETIKNVTLATIKNEWMKESQIEIVSSMQNLYMQIALSCFFGQSCDTSQYLDYYQGGVVKKMRIGETIRNTFQTANMRGMQPLLILFRELAPYFITRFDREVKRNAETMRNYILRLIKERKQKVVQSGVA